MKKKHIKNSKLLERNISISEYINMYIESEKYFKVWNTDRLKKEFDKFAVFEYKNVPIFIQIGYDNLDEYENGKELVSVWISLYLPSDISDPYDYEDKRTNELRTGKMMWRDLHTRPDEYIIKESIGGYWDHNNDSYGWESLDDSSDLYTTEYLIKVAKEPKYNIMEFEQIKNVDCYVVVAYDDDENKYGRMLRIVQYVIKNIRGSKWLKDGQLIVSASQFVHDYTHFRTLRSSWKQFPMIQPKNKIVVAD
jgi:hypothetical protein